MYAVIAHGGKQYRVAPGDVIRVERVKGVTGEKGTTVEFGDVRLSGAGTDLKLGKAASSLKVVGTVTGVDFGPKVLIFKKKRCKQYRRTRGHRQGFSEIRIDRIV